MTEFLIILLVICVAAIPLITIIAMIIDLCKNKDIDYDLNDSAIDIKLDEPEDPQDKDLRNVIEKTYTENREIGNKKRKPGQKYTCTYLYGYQCAFRCKEKCECEAPELICDYMKEKSNTWKNEVEF